MKIRLNESIRLCPCRMASLHWSDPNRTIIQIQQTETVKIYSLIGKQMNVETVITEQTERTSSKIGICPRIVNLNPEKCNNSIEND